MEADKAIAISIMLILAVFGITFHVTILILKWRLKSMHRPFFMLLSCLSIGDAGALLIFLFWCVPALIWEIPADSNYLRTNIPGFISVTLYHVGAFAALAISLNRFTAIWFPTKYQVIFEPKNVKWMVLAVWVISIAVCIPLLVPPCSFYYYYPLFIWVFGDNYCSYVFSEFSGNVLDISLFAAILLINWATFYKIRKQKKNGNLSEEQKRKQRKEMTFFVQSTLTGFVYVGGLCCFFCAARVISYRWGLFFCTTGSWMFEHVVNGLIFLMGNQETREATVGQITVRLGCTKKTTQIHPTSQASSTQGTAKTTHT